MVKGYYGSLILAADFLHDLGCLVFDDHGIDDFDDGLAVAFREFFQGLEAPIEPAAAELGVIQRIACEQVVDAGAERVGEFDEHLGRRCDQPALYLLSSW